MERHKAGKVIIYSGMVVRINVLAVALSYARY
jgi:hypothetical protein